MDRVQPEDFVIEQITNRGNYVHGIFNFANKDKYRPSDGHNIVYNNGECYLFTGLTSVGADDSAIGFIMVDMVTKEPIMYEMSGATEEAGQLSAQGRVQDLGYQASFPIILNIDSQPTYFMTLNDDIGLIKQYAFVSVTNYSTVGTGRVGQRRAARLRKQAGQRRRDHHQQSQWRNRDGGRRDSAHRQRIQRRAHHLQIPAGEPAGHPVHSAGVGQPGTCPHPARRPGLGQLSPLCQWNCGCRLV